MKKLIFVYICIFFNEVMAGKGEVVGLPMQFHIESGVLSVDACLMVNEKNISTEWQKSNGKQSSEIIQTLKDVIESLVNKDRDRFFQLSHDTYGRDPKLFEEQVAPFFSQFERVSVVDVPRVYEFDDLRVYFVKFKYKSSLYYAPFIFKYQADKKLGFLPYRTEALSYQLVQDWFLQFWSKGGSVSPKYCDLGLIEKANYQILLNPEIKSLFDSSILLIKGQYIDKLIKNNVDQNKLIKFFSNLKLHLSKNDLSEYTKLFTVEGESRLKEWLNNIDANQLKFYKESVSGQTPIFMFNLGKVFVVYTKSQRGVMVFYLFNDQGSLKWVNSSHITRADAVFKRNDLIKSAELDTPFVIFKK